jgi:type-F conjugative transfer system pilin assembly thiol-disulfide isomerase TrbB
MLFHKSLLPRIRRVACYGLIPFLFTTTAFASTLDDIRALEATKERPAASPVTQATSSRPVRLFSLPDGRQVNAADYRIVLFMQGGCHFCQQFDPQLAQFSAQTGFKVFPYTLDGRGDVSFPEAIPAPRAVLDQFFGPGNNGVTPTTWLVNVNTLQSWPLAQGIIDMNTLLQRINQALIPRQG